MFSETKQGELALCFQTSHCVSLAWRLPGVGAAFQVRIIQSSTMISSFEQLTKKWHPWSNQTTLSCKLLEGSARLQWMITVWECNSERKNKLIFVIFEGSWLIYKESFSKNTGYFKLRSMMLCNRLVMLLYLHQARQYFNRHLQKEKYLKKHI